MAYIHYNKDQLKDLELSFVRETLQTNGNGAYCSSTLINCNTRKYHGLLVAPQPQIDENNYVLLSALDETIIQNDKSFPFATHQYPALIQPQGYLYLEEFSCEKIPQWTMKAGDCLLRKEMMLVKDEDRVLVRYTILEANTPSRIQFMPFLAFRNIHTVGKSNIHTNKKTIRIGNGVKTNMYNGFTDLCLQFSKKTEFTSAPDWYYNIEYQQEKERGYEYREDLYRPGFFELPVKEGDQFIFSAGLEEISPRKLKSLFESELNKRSALENLNNCLNNAAHQFIVHRSKITEITAGFHWFGRWGRDTFIALPGLTLSTGNPKECKAVLDSMLKELKNGLFPNVGSGQKASYNSADASLWFFRALQQYADYTGTASLIWKEYGKKMRSVLDYYRKGTALNIHMLDNGLLYAGETGIAVTWMDAVVDGKPVTPRIGLAVEINALWYNAICFALEAAAFAGDKAFIKEWSSIPAQIEISFKQVFWSEEMGYLADYAGTDFIDWSLRPNQVIAASLPYSPIDDSIKKSLLRVIKDKLLTPRGLRTLSSDDKNYRGVCYGDQRSRDLAYHQGTVWPWLLGHFSEAYAAIYKEDAVPFIQSLYENFAPALFEYGIGTIAEIFDGDAPYKARGAISQAWSVAELLRMFSFINTGLPASYIPASNVQPQQLS